MKVAILGTRGIPNYYGGFEQFAEYLSRFLAGSGHDVTVYSSHSHPYQQSSWNGVHLRHCHNPEDRLGTLGQFVYDLNCIMDARKQQYDIILQLGYSSNSVWSGLLPRNAIIMTNMDGLEWKRIKYSLPVRRFLKWAEKMAVRSSDYLIADSIAIQDHLYRTYRVESEYIPYGANLFYGPDPENIRTFSVERYQYDMLIARLEPENSIESILEGVSRAANRRPFLVVGNDTTKFGTYLKKRFAAVSRIRFPGSIYDIGILNNLRFYSQCYFHGHTVGGTNPSLLEAMASDALICAHDNIFNRTILGSDAFYFENSDDIAIMLERSDKKEAVAAQMIKNNREKIALEYNWQKVNSAYEALLVARLHEVRSKFLPGHAFSVARQVSV